MLFIVGSFLTYLAVNSLRGILLREVDAGPAMQVQQGEELKTGRAAVAIDDGQVDTAESEANVSEASGQK